MFVAVDEVIILNAPWPAREFAGFAATDQL